MSGPATLHLHDPDLAVAASELLDNVERLRLAGRYAAACRAACRLVEPGAWSCPPAGALHRRAAGLVPRLAWMAGCDCRGWEGQPERTWASLATEMEAQGNRSLHLLALGTGLQSQPAGTGWTRAWLAALPDSVGTTRSAADFNRFASELEQLLKVRVRAALALDDPLYALLPIEVEATTNAFEHGWLSDLALAGWQRGGPLHPRTWTCLQLALLLDLHAGANAAALDRLQRWLPALAGASGCDALIQLWPPYVELLRGGQLAPLLGIHDLALAGWQRQLEQRRASRSWPPPPQLDWPLLLDRHAAAVAIEMSDPQLARNETGMLRFQRPFSPLLSERAGRGEWRSPGLDERALAAIEQRLQLALPPSYRCFLQASDGLLSASGAGISLLPGAEIDWLHRLDREWLEGWICEDSFPEASDAEYELYGPDQDCIHMRTRHLHSALQISTEIDGDVLLLVPAVRFGAEWEAWMLGSKNPGAIRFRSFAELALAWVLRS